MMKPAASTSETLMHTKDGMVDTKDGVVDTANVTFWLRTLLQQNSDLVEVVAKLEAVNRWVWWRIKLSNVLFLILLCWQMLKCEMNVWGLNSSSCLNVVMASHHSDGAGNKETQHLAAAAADEIIASASLNIACQAGRGGRLVATQCWSSLDGAWLVLLCCNGAENKAEMIASWKKERIAVTLGALHHAMLGQEQSRGKDENPSDILPWSEFWCYHLLSFVVVVMFWCLEIVMLSWRTFVMWAVPSACDVDSKPWPFFLQTLNLILTFFFKGAVGPRENLQTRSRSITNNLINYNSPDQLQIIWSMIIHYVQNVMTSWPWFW